MRITVDHAALVVKLLEAVPEPAHVIDLIAGEPRRAVLALRTSLEDNATAGRLRGLSML